MKQLSNYFMINLNSVLQLQKLQIIYKIYIKTECSLQLSLMLAFYFFTFFFLFFFFQILLSLLEKYRTTALFLEVLTKKKNDGLFSNLSANCCSLLKHLELEPIPHSIFRLFSLATEGKIGFFFLSTLNTFLHRQMRVNL